MRRSWGGTNFTTFEDLLRCGYLMVYSEQTGKVEQRVRMQQ